ncbi:MAG TPA: alpha/beta fold hydrolase [Gemmatimonadaceae bacterium]|nr:alpha/beta fold hydrolase [Gemmatimonadaceae bacterium]
MPVPLLLGAGLVAAGLLAWRTWYVRHVEGADRDRPRNADGELAGAEGFALPRPGAPAVLLVHGAGDTPQTLRGLGAYLHARGFAVAAPRLPAHGTSIREFRHVSSRALRDAVHRAHEALRAEHRWVAIVGLSMGGALSAIETASERDVPALVLLAPYLDLPLPIRIVSHLGWLLGPLLPYFSAEDSRSVRDPRAATESRAYGVFTPAGLRTLREVADGARAVLPRIVAPTLIIQSRQDNRVAERVAEQAFAALGPADKRLEWISDGGHVITVDYGRDRVFAAVADWLDTHGASSLLRS